MDVKIETPVVEIDIGTKIKAIFGCLGAHLDGEWVATPYLQYRGGGEWAILRRNGTPTEHSFKTSFKPTDNPRIEEAAIPLLVDTGVECRGGYMYMTSEILHEKKRVEWARYFGDGRWLKKYSRGGLEKCGKLLQ